MARLNFLSQSIFRMPLVWGALSYMGFIYLVESGVLAYPDIERYFTSHPVEHVTTVLFFTGLSALIIKLIDVVVEWANLDRISLSPVPRDGQPVDDASSLIDELARLPEAAKNSYLGLRLREALEFVCRKGAAENLDDQLRHLADVDYERMQASYSLTRIVIWAIPILGFLGTVIGITLAIAKLSPEALETSLPEVTNGLGVAFDTTALALALSIVLMFVKFFIERMETQLLSTVDDRMSQLLVGRFQEYGTGSDPNSASIRRMAETVVAATESLVERQAQLWNATIEMANSHWSELTNETSEQMQTALAGALNSGLQQHADAMMRGEQEIADENRRHWDRLHRMLIESSQAVASQQAEMIKQGGVLREVVEAMGQVQNLETTLNNNLAALAGAHNFEETVMSLSAAIQLLSARLGHEPPGGTRVELSHGTPSHSAA